VGERAEGPQRRPRRGQAWVIVFFGTITQDPGFGREFGSLPIGGRQPDGPSRPDAGIRFPFSNGRLVPQICRRVRFSAWAATRYHGSLRAPAPVSDTVMSFRSQIWTRI
jgi:hypothetical protein